MRLEKSEIFSTLQIREKPLRKNKIQTKICQKNCPTFASKLKLADNRLGVIHEQDLNKDSIVLQHVCEACGQVSPK